MLATKISYVTTHFAMLCICFKKIVFLPVAMYLLIRVDRFHEKQNHMIMTYETMNLTVRRPARQVAG